MISPFDESEARESLAKKEQLRKASLEKERLATLEQSIQVLKQLFADQDIEIFLVGSVTEENSFREDSDVDIVLKNFKGNRFDVWPLLEEKIGRRVEIILYEKSHFQDHIDKKGLKVL